MCCDRHIREDTFKTAATGQVTQIPPNSRIEFLREPIIKRPRYSASYAFSHNAAPHLAILSVYIGDNRRSELILQGWGGVRIGRP
jgi:hypothetical protein